MKKIILVFVMLSAIFTSLSAKSIYIKVMSVKDKSSLYILENSLHEYGYNMHVTKYKNWYRVYTGPFTNFDRAKKSLDIIQRNVFNGAYISLVSFYKNKVLATKVYAKQIEKIKPKMLKKQEIKKHKKIVFYPNVTDVPSYHPKKIYRKKVVKSCKNSPNSNNKYFVGLIGGFSKIDVKENDISGSMPLNISLKDSALSYGIEGGYYFNNNIFMALDYVHTDLKNLYFDGLFATINYQLDRQYGLYPFFGLIAGYNQMKWKNSPIDSLQTTDTASSSMFGAQTGVDIPLADSISMYILYRYIKLDYTTDLKTSSAQKEIKYSGDNNLNIGIKYNF